jgi:hypothetical protein
MKPYTDYRSRSHRKFEAPRHGEEFHVYVWPSEVLTFGNRFTCIPAA